jgi:translation initiation factor 3 subunit M
MPAPVNTLLIDGSFEELCEELAAYLDDLRKKQGDENANLKGDVSPLLEDGRKDDALKKVVTASSVLNSAPEKGMELAPVNRVLYE